MTCKTCNGTKQIRSLSRDQGFTLFTCPDCDPLPQETVLHWGQVSEEIMEKVRRVARRK